jgi:hypothetical protein
MPPEHEVGGSNPLGRTIPPKKNQAPTDLAVYPARISVAVRPTGEVA